MSVLIAIPARYASTTLSGQTAGAADRATGNVDDADRTVLAGRKIGLGVDRLWSSPPMTTAFAR